MDKIILTNLEKEALMKWRDEHKVFVRYCPTPMKAVRICLPDDHVEYTAVRETDTKLRFSLSYKGKPYGSLVMEQMVPSLKWGLIRDTLTGSKIGKLLDPEIHQSCLTIYASLMALMVYGNEFVLPDPENTHTTQSDSPVVDAGRTQRTASPRKANKPAKNPSKKPSVTYILSLTKTGPTIRPRGTHASPNGIFSVRGHYRHYKSGKVVWIAEYKKGTGRKKNTIYKIGSSDTVKTIRSPLSPQSPT